MNAVARAPDPPCQRSHTPKQARATFRCQRSNPKRYGETVKSRTCLLLSHSELLYRGPGLLVYGLYYVTAYLANSVWLRGLIYSPRPRIVRPPFFKTSITFTTTILPYPAPDDGVGDGCSGCSHIHTDKNPDRSYRTHPYKQE